MGNKFDIMNLKGTYTSKSIGGPRNDLEAARERPGRFLGSNDAKAINQQVREVVENAIDEALTVYKLSNGQSHMDIVLEFYEDSSVRVKDEGRGLPMGVDSTSSDESVRNVDAIYRILEKDKSGGKHRSDFVEVDGYAGVRTVGLHGAGLCATVGTSVFFEVKNAFISGDGVYSVKYEKGQRVQDLTRIGDFERNKDGSIQTGLEVYFKYDEDVLHLIDEYKGRINYPFEIYYWRDRLYGHALEGEGFTIHFYYTLPGQAKQYEKFDTREITFETKLMEYAETGAKPNTVNISNPAMGYDIELNIVSSGRKTLRYASVNMISVEEGSHAQAFEEEFSTYIENRLNKENVYNKNYPPRDILSTLSYMIRLQTDNPTFSGQAKFKFVDGKLKMDLKIRFREMFLNNEIPMINNLYKKFKSEYKRYVDYQKEIEARKKQEEQELARIQSQKSRVINLQEKDEIEGKILFPVETDFTKCDLIILEGDSGFQNIAQARQDYQAVMPIRGKMINPLLKQNIPKLMINNEVKRIDYALNHLKFRSVYIMTDGDADGKHIRSLVYAVIAVIAPHYFEQGRVFFIDVPYSRGTLATPYKGQNPGQKISFYREIDFIEFHASGGRCSSLMTYKGIASIVPSLIKELLVNPEFHYRIDPQTVEEGLLELTKWLSSSSDYKKDYVQNTFCTPRLREYLQSKKERPGLRNIKFDLNTFMYDYSPEPDYNQF